MNSQRPKSITDVIHHTIVASQINFQGGRKPPHGKDAGEQKEKGAQALNASKVTTAKKGKNQEKDYKGQSKSSLKKMEQFWKESKHFKCGEQGHVLHVCPKKTQGNGIPKASTIEVLKDEGNSKGENLSSAWRRVRYLDALILFDLGSTHNFISHEMALELRIHEFEMGDHILANRAFKGQEVSITPLVGKLYLHIQGYVDKEYFYISPLKHEDVIFSMPWNLTCNF